MEKANDMSNKEKKHLKLKKAHINNIKISDYNLKNKYTYFEDSKLDESKTLIYEIESKPTKFKRYSRGQIVRVKFGVNIGSEFSGDHYGIVISKGDTMLNPVLHIIPLTSKKHNYNISMKNILYDDNLIEDLKNKLKEIKDKKEIKKISNVIKYYEKRKNKKSYACIKHLKTISKLSIQKHINEYDYINKIKVNAEILKQIDNEIVKEYTLLNIKK